MGADQFAERAKRARVGAGAAVALTWAVAGGLAYVSLACGGSGPAERATATIAVAVDATPTPDAVSPSGDPAVTVENAVLACREKDDDRMRSFVTVSVSDEELRAFFAQGTLERLAARAPPEIEGDRATVEVRLEVRHGGETELVERTWELVQGTDGLWRFTTLPDCF